MVRLHENNAQRYRNSIECIQRGELARNRIAAVQRGSTAETEHRARNYADLFFEPCNALRVHFEALSNSFELDVYLVSFSMQGISFTY